MAVAVVPTPCRPPTSLLVQGQLGGPAPMALRARSPHAAKRSAALGVGSWQASRRPLAAFPPLSTPTQWTPSTSLLWAWLCGTAALDRFLMARFQGPASWPPFHLMDAASASRVNLCCTGGVLVCDVRVIPPSQGPSARLRGVSRPDAAETSIKRVIVKPTWTSFSEHTGGC